MGLSKTRKLLSVILSVLVAAATALLLFSFVVTATVVNEPVSEKLIINDDLITECEAQLDAGLQTLQAETGIPLRVFEQVKEDFPVATELTSAYQNQFNEESQTLYNQNMVNYFYKLCTEYLKGNNVKYEDKNIVITAEKAARLYSAAVGLQNAEGVAEKTNAIRRVCNRLALSSGIILILLSLLMTYLYTYQTKAYAYLTAGFSSGSLAAALTALLLIVFRAPAQVTLSPAVYEAAYQSLLRSCFFIVAVAGFILFALLYFILIRLETRVYKNSLD